MALDEAEGETLRPGGGRRAMMPAIAAVLVNYNAGAELSRALQSLADDFAGREWEVIVVDNASSDGSEQVAQTFAPRVRLLRNASNVGFGRGANQGVAACSAP